MPAKSTPIRKAPLFTPYVIVWSMFGLLSFGLLAVLGLTPEWLDDFRPAATLADAEGRPGQRAVERVAADVDQLKSSVSQIQLDLAQIRTDLVAQGEQQKATNSALSALQSRLPETAVAAAGDTSLDASPADRASAPQAGADNRVEEPAGPALNTQDSPRETAKDDAPATTTVAKPRVINADAGPSAEKTSAEAGSKTASSNLETGSLQKSGSNVISFGPAVVKPAPQPVGIKLSTGASLESLRLSWALLTENHSDKLSKLEPRYTTAGNAVNPEFDLIAGPVKSKTEANRICRALVEQGVPCTVGSYIGNSL